MPEDRRPPRFVAPRFPAPHFPVPRPRLFAATPPAIFPVILGLLGLGLALRKACEVTGLPGDPVEAVLGALAGLWLFAILAIGVKLFRRPSVLMQDLRPLPGRAGLSAATMSAMAMAGVLLPYAPPLALILVVGALGAHGGLALLVARGIERDIESRRVDPTWHLSFAGFILAVPVLAQLGWQGSARVIFALTFLAAMTIWLTSLVQLTRRLPPAPLRPLLATHLPPAALLSLSAALIGQPELATILLGLAALIFVLLLASARWLVAAGFTALWGAFTFPLAAFALALMAHGGPATVPGLILTTAALGITPILAWKILKLWPGGKLAARTNAATA